MATLGSGLTRTEAGVGGPRCVLRTGHGASQHRRPRASTRRHGCARRIRICRRSVDSTPRRSSRTSGLALYDVAPFANRLPDDTFWAARQVMAFTDDDIRAIVAGCAVLRPEGRTVDCRLPDRAAQPNRPHLLRQGAPARRLRGARRRADVRRSGGAVRVRDAARLPRRTG